MKISLIDRLFLTVGVFVTLIVLMYYRTLSSIEKEGTSYERKRVNNVLYKEITEDLEKVLYIRRSPEFQDKEKAEDSGRSRESITAKIHSRQPRDLSSVSQDLVCPNGSLVQFWRRPTLNDQQYRSPFIDESQGAKYVTFEPDVGGWNNIRMQMETVLVFAAATGRTLVLPPDQPMYLLNKGMGHSNVHSFVDFFPFEWIQRVVQVISMGEFLRREAVTGQLRHAVSGLPFYPPGNRSNFSGTVPRERNAMWDYLRNATACPPWKCMREYLVIPRHPGFNSSMDPAAEQFHKREVLFAGDPKFGMKRERQIYNEFWHSKKVVHFISKPGTGHRLLQHFYTFLHFEDPAMGSFYKRFVRDYVHYIPLIFCRAASIVARLLEIGNGFYSSLHVRRGEFQYRETRLPAEELLKNIGNLIPSGELLFIATDERDKSFFEPFKKRFPRIMFLDDFYEMAGLSGLNPNYLGMIDQVICTRGRLFMGTWFSTFTGYITRMRGYLDYADNTTYYTDLKHRNRFQKYEHPRFPFYMREFPLAWRNINDDGIIKSN